MSKTTDTHQDPIVGYYEHLESQEQKLSQELDWVREQKKVVKQFGNGHFSGMQVVTRTPRKTSKKTKKASTARRDAAAIETLMTNITNWVASNDGCTASEISGGINVPTRDLALPIRKLVETKQLRKKGERSHTQYFATAKGKRN